MYEINDLFDKRSIVGAKLERIIAEKGFTKISFSKACGVSRPTLDKILAGNLNSKTNYDKHLEKILKCLSLSPDMLLSNVSNNRTRRLRESLRVREKELAEAISVSVDRLREIESGISVKPSELKDIAVCLGTSTSCVDGTYYFFPQMSTLEYLIDDHAEISGFWGHIGIQLSDSELFYWFPITGHTYKEVICSTNKEWMVIPCMNNKLLFINVANINNLLLLDDACDPPGFANWDPGIGEGQIPQVVYETLEDYFYCDDVKAAIEEGLFSEKFCEYMEDIIKEYGWTEQQIDEMTSYISVHYKNGQTLKTSIEFNADGSLFEKIAISYEFEDSSLMGRFLSFYDLNEALHFINTDNVSMIELPLVQAEEVLKEMEED